MHIQEKTQKRASNGDWRTGESPENLG